MFKLSAGLLVGFRFLIAADTISTGTDTPDTFSPIIIIAETDGSDSGEVRFALFDRSMADSWDDSVLLAEELPACGRKVVWKTAPVPDGMYALAVFHDCNGNDELDKNCLGKPVEPYGFSNNIRHLLGPPDIKEATFRFEASKRTIVVKLH